MRTQLPYATAYSLIAQAPEDAAPQDKAFPYHLPMEATQKSLAGIPLAMFYPALLAFVGASGFIGSIVGRAMPGMQIEGISVNRLFVIMHATTFDRMPPCKHTVEPETKDVTSIGAAAVFGAGAVFASVQAKKKRASASVVDLYNTIVDLPDPSNLTPEDVAAVGAKYGVTMQKDELEGLQKIYGQFLEAVIPSGETQLK